MPSMHQILNVQASVKSGSETVSQLNSSPLSAFVQQTLKVASPFPRLFHLSERCFFQRSRTVLDSEHTPKAKIGSRQRVNASADGRGRVISASPGLPLLASRALEREKGGKGGYEIVLVLPCLCVPSVCYQLSSRL